MERSRERYGTRADTLWTALGRSKKIECEALVVDLILLFSVPLLCARGALRAVRVLFLDL